MHLGTTIIKGCFESIKKAIELYGCQLDPSSCLFVLFRMEYNTQGDVEHDFLDVITIGTESGLTYINTIVAPTEDRAACDLPDNVLYIIWFAKDVKSMHFDKDAIRESHIWKDVEWGHRAKNYNPKGKDPGNVWIPTEDDGKGNITNHILLDNKAIISRINSCTKQDSLKSLFLSDDKDDSGLCAPEMLFEALETTGTPVPQFKRRKSVSNRSANQSNRVSAKVIWGTSEDMSMLGDESVDLVVTSPPYWDLKDYFKKGQIGQESYQQYLDRLETVWKGCYDKLRENGSFWLNINIRVKNNHVILIPRDFVQQCKRIGFHYKGVLIWHKSSGIPTHDKNIVDRHEYVLVFSKSDHLSLNDDILSFADYCNEKMNGGLFWNINRKAGSVGKHYIHPAIYPNELVERIVKCASSEGDMVMDPFLGSGTTMIASILEGRSCVGFEYNEGFKDLIISRIQSDIGLYANYDLSI